MIGGDDDERAGAGGLDEPADLPVDGGNLAVIRRRRVARLQGAGRIVWIVCVEQVHP